MASLKDIAAAAGVSIRTVTRALYDKGYVKQERKEEILRLAQEMGYRPNRKARSLRSGKTYEITAVITNVGELTAAKIAAAETVFRENGYSLNLMFMAGEEEPKVSWSEVADEIMGRHPAGIIFFNRPGRLFDEFKTVSLPVLSVDMDPVEDYTCDTVGIDRQQGVYEAVTHLIKQGRKRIAYIGHHQESRLVGYRRALEEHGLEQLYMEQPSQPKGQFEYGRDLGRKFHELPGSPDAVQAYTDETALGFLAGLHDIGVKVPDEVAVIGFDNRRAAALASPPLTSVAQPNQAVGQAAAELLLKRIRKEAETEDNISIQVPTTLTIRESA